MIVQLATFQLGQNLAMTDAHISYAVGTDYWGQGIVTTALKIAVSKVFKEFPDLVRIEAMVELKIRGLKRC